MPNLELSIRACDKEMAKLALPFPWQAIKGGLQRAGGGLGAGLGIGGGAGALGGTIYGGVQGYQQAREEGAGVPHALLGGLSQGISSGLKGGIYGALAGGALGGGAGAARVISPEQVARASQMKGVGALARAGQRQVHGLTGWKPEAGIRSIRGGAYDAAEKLKKIETGKTAPGMYDKLKGRVLGQSAQNVQLSAAKKGLTAAETAERMKLTSLPGYVVSMIDKPIDTIRAGVTEQWRAGGPVSKAMAFGLPAYGVAKELGTDNPEGPGKAERVGSALGSLAYSMGSLPLGTQMLLGELVSQGGRRAGAYLDKGKADPTKGYTPIGRFGSLERSPGTSHALQGMVMSTGKELGI